MPIGRGTCSPRTSEKKAKLAHRKAEANRFRAEGGRPPYMRRQIVNKDYYLVYRDFPDRAVREAILRNVPRSADQVERMFARLCVDLRAIDPGCHPNGYHPARDQWAKLAANRVGRQAAFEAATRFDEIYASATGPSAIDRITDRVRAVVAKEYPDTTRTDHADVVRTAIAAFAREVNKKFVALSCRVLAACTGLSHSTCARLLTKLVGTGVLVVATPGIPSPFDRRATVYDVSALVPEKLISRRLPASNAAVTDRKPIPVAVEMSMQDRLDATFRIPDQHRALAIRLGLLPPDSSQVAGHENSQRGECGTTCVSLGVEPDGRGDEVPEGLPF